MGRRQGPHEDVPYHLPRVIQGRAGIGQEDVYCPRCVLRTPAESFFVTDNMQHPIARKMIAKDLGVSL